MVKTLVLQFLVCDSYLFFLLSSSNLQTPEGRPQYGRDTVDGNLKNKLNFWFNSQIRIYSVQKSKTFDLCADYLYW